MMVSDQADYEKSRRLANQIIAVIRSQMELSAGEALGACMMVIFAMYMTLVQQNAADAMRGRVVSVYSLAFRGAMPLGNLAAVCNH